MIIFESSSPRKNTKISFRTDDITLAKLKAICRIENTTISALIENVLKAHVLRQENPMQETGEKRQSPRKHCAIPAVISAGNGENMFFSNGTIVNISSSSMQIIMKNIKTESILANGFYVLFSIPNHDHPLFIPCQIVRANHVLDESIIVAVFECKDVHDKDIIQKFVNLNNLFSETGTRRRQRPS